MSEQYAAADADLEAPVDTIDASDHNHDHDHDHTCPDCGEVHEQGWGQDFLRAIAVLGLDHPSISTAITNALLDRGVPEVVEAVENADDDEEFLNDDEEFLNLPMSRDALLSICQELAFPDPKRLIADWEAPENENARTGSRWLARYLILAIKDLGVALEGVMGVQGYLHPSDAATVKEALEYVGAGVERLVAFQANLLQREVNVDLTAQNETEITDDTSTPLDLPAAGPFGESVLAAAERGAEIVAFMDKSIRDAVAEGTSFEEASLEAATAAKAKYGERPFASA